MINDKGKGTSSQQILNLEGICHKNVSFVFL